MDNLKIWVFDNLCKEVQAVIREKQNEHKCLICLADEDEIVKINVFFITDNFATGWKPITETKPINRYDVCIGIIRFFKQYK